MGEAEVGLLLRRVMELSEAGDWDHARREWEVADCCDDPMRTETCVCGKEGLRYQYTIVNKENGNTLFPIGSTCIRKFEVDELDRETACWRQAFKLMDRAAELGRGRRIGIHDRCFSRKLLAFMADHDVFVPNRYNGGDGYRDYLFLLGMFNAHETTPAQERRADAIIRDSVYPWLRGLWRRRVFTPRSL